MGLWSLLFGWGKRVDAPHAAVPPPKSARRRQPRQVLEKVGRRCRFEQMEERQMLDADPLKLGVIYIEEDGGSDLHGDTFELTYEGGAPGSELSRVIIDGDHGPRGLSVGDMIFDTVHGGLGADQSFAFQVVSITGGGSVSAQVVDGSSQLILNFSGFHAGDKLRFSIDVDEIQQFDAEVTNLDEINSGIDPIASGVEFQDSLLTGTFKESHHYDAIGSVKFKNVYDPLFAGSNLLISATNPNGLPYDDYQGKRDRSTGTMLTVQQQPLPVTISGFVYLEYDLDLQRDADEPPISGVSLTLFKRQGAEFVSTGKTATTDAQGFYKFGEDLNLTPGIYQVRETQPSGYFSVGAIPGNVSGNPTGATVSGNPDILTEINIPLGNQHGVRYDFAESQPASLSGRVFVDPNQDCFFNSGDRPLGGVTVQLLNSAGTVVQTTQTDGQGQYRFEILRPGTYSVRELQPQGYFQGGQKAGSGGGDDSQTDLISRVNVLAGANLVQYDFCELEPASISGRVFVDPNEDCFFNEGDRPLGGVTVQLVSSNGTVLQTTQTDNEGRYRFDNLLPGTYSVRELQPQGYFQGGQRAGSGGGDDSHEDLISQVNLSSGANLIEYDFCEIEPVSLAGRVFVDTNGNCLLEPGEQSLSGVQIDLLDGNGIVVATTFTDSLGQYQFSQLGPNNYSVREHQPGGYFHGGQVAGNLGGDASNPDLILDVPLTSGRHATEYNFCEQPAGSISGFVFRDGPVIFTPDGKPPTNLYDIRDGLLTPDDQRIGGVLLELRFTGSARPVTAADVLPGFYAPGPLRVRTNADGYYVFRGLPAGDYTVVEVQPAGYLDSRDTPGTAGGLALNQNTALIPGLIDPFVFSGVRLGNDAILRVRLGAGEHALLNNFSEVQITTFVIPPPPPELPLPPPEVPPTFIPPPIELPPQIFIPPPPVPDVPGHGGKVFTWHLSVIDAGLPRSTARTARTSVAFRPIMFVDATQWKSERLRAGTWQIDTLSPEIDQPMAYGIENAIPVVGDWDGDGVAEIGIYYKGEWLLDLNGNGKWDADDLWAKLGTEADLPVVGDWDGDGKDDIGIFGPEWSGDPRHHEHEPGLPDPQNVVKKRPKNVPPDESQATDGERLLRRTAQGKERSDLIDHVFYFGVESDKPIAGDWNGDGISSIGVYRDGTWHFDMDGDGRWSPGDQTAEFGREGDIPVVGDFNGDGVDEIGIYRSGRWIIDTNGNRQIDAADKVFEMGTAGDKPVVGDFNGDGTDDPGLYKGGGPAAETASKD